MLQVYGVLIMSGMVAWQHTGVAQWFISHAVIEYVGYLIHFIKDWYFHFCGPLTIVCYIVTLLYDCIDKKMKLTLIVPSRLPCKVALYVGVGDHCFCLPLSMKVTCKLFASKDELLGK